MRSYTRVRRLLGATALAVAVLVAMAPVAGAATAPPKVQVTVTDDFSSGSIRFVVDGVPQVVEPNTYKVGLTNNSIGPHVLVAVGGLPEDITVDEFRPLTPAERDGVDEEVQRLRAMRGV